VRVPAGPWVRVQLWEQVEPPLELVAQGVVPLEAVRVSMLSAVLLSSARRSPLGAASLGGRTETKGIALTT
jgi:hypothetical protein